MFAEIFRTSNSINSPHVGKVGPHKDNNAGALRPVVASGWFSVGFHSTKTCTSLAKLLGLQLHRLNPCLGLFSPWNGNWASHQLRTPMMLDSQQPKTTATKKLQDSCQAIVPVLYATRFHAVRLLKGYGIKVKDFSKTKPFE